METTFREILLSLKKDDLFEFLKNLSFDQRRKLMQVINQKDATGWRIIPEEIRSEPRMRDRYYSMLDFAEIVCSTQKQLTKVHHETFRQEVKELDFIDWFEPGWFNNYINSKQFLGTLYQKSNWYMAMIPWVEKEYINPNPELISSVLWTEERQDFPEITFRKHIWYLFEYPQRYCWGNDDWIKKFENFVAEGKIDRLLTLKEIVLTASRTFPKQQAEWFMNLFVYLKPANPEILALQDELLAGLSNQFSKVVKTLLTYIQPVCTDKNFNIDNLICYLPVVFSSTIKANLMLGMKITTCILKKRPEYVPVVLMAQNQVFLCKDEAIQRKAAELYIKYGDSNNTQIRQALTEIETHIFLTVKEDLSPFLGQQVEEEQSTKQYQAVLPEISGLEMKVIDMPHTVEGFIFWLYEFFDHPQVNQYEQFYQLLIRFSTEMIHFVNYLEPSVKLVGKKIGGWQQNNSIAFATSDFYFRYLIQLTEKYPVRTVQLKKIVEENLPNKGFFKHGYEKNSFVRTLKEKWYEQLLRLAIDEKTHTILSVPTHDPVWIDPVLFIERLMWYEQTCQEPTDIDMQLAIQRIHFTKQEDVLFAAAGLITPEYHALINYLFRKIEPDTKQIRHKAWWQTAALTRPDRPESYFLEETKSVLLPLANRIKNLFSQNSNFLLYQYLSSATVNDFLWLLGFCPNNTDAVVYQIIKAFENGNIDGQNGINILEFITNLNRTLTPLEEELLANSLWVKDKTTRLYAAVCWLQKINQQQISPIDLGIKLGCVANNNPTSLKRFTDLVYDQMLNGNMPQKQVLEVSVKYMLSEIKEPIANLKTLLEIYSELLIANQSGVDELLLSKLQVWQENKTLSKAVTAILTYTP